MKSDDPNHFDPNYFGKGYRWHDPQVNKMIEAYEEARIVTEANGCQIMNATVGGKLEVFKRVSYDSLFPKPGPQSDAAPPADGPTSSSKNGTGADHPRLLIIDHTLSGNGTATGEVKKSLFKGWRAENILQLYTSKAHKIGVHAQRLPRGADAERLSLDDAVSIAVGFAPQVILYRPVPNQAVLHETAMAIVERLDVPLVVWMMDDWPAFQTFDGSSASMLDRDLRHLLKKAKLCLSICDSMSDAFGKRYGVPFKAYANGIDPNDWSSPKKDVDRNRLLVRYSGSLADNMALDSVVRIAEAIEELNAEGVPTDFEIKTSPYWFRLVASRFRVFKHTAITTAVLPESEYRQWLATSDVNIIAYNFDERTLAYVRYSLANKLPECLASGAAVLVHGPEGLPTVDAVKGRDCAVVVSSPELAKVKEAIRRLASRSERDALATRARQVAASNFDVRKMREALRSDIAAVASPAIPLEHACALTVAYPPASGARIDEGEAVSAVLADHDGEERVMLSIGTDPAPSTEYFAAKGWTVYCAGKHAADCNGTAQAGMTTVAEVMRQRGLKTVDLLRIDATSGGLSVLDGVPWDVTQPSVVQVEFDDSRATQDGFYRDIASCLVERGYCVYLSEWHPERPGTPRAWYRLKRYPCDLAHSQGQGHLIAFLDDPGARLAGAFERCLTVRPTSKLAGRTRSSRIKYRLATLAREFRSKIGYWLRAKHPSCYGVVSNAESAVVHLVRQPVLLMLFGLAIALGLFTIAFPTLSGW